MSFLDSPVALKTTKSLLVKNIGPGIVDFRAVPSKSFTVNPSSGSLAPGADLQLTFEFFPQVFSATFFFIFLVNLIEELLKVSAADILSEPVNHAVDIYSIHLKSFLLENWSLHRMGPLPLRR